MTNYRFKNIILKRKGVCNLSRRIKKVIKVLISIVFFSNILVGCSNVASEDALERAQRTNKIIWGINIETRSFGTIDLATGEYEGFSVDIARALTEEILGVEGNAEFVDVSSKTRVPLLKNGNIDAVAATMTITPERLEVIDFSDVYFEAGQSLLVKKGSDVRSVKDLDATKTVLVTKGATSAKTIKEVAPEVQILEMETYGEAFVALKAGRGDALTTDNTILYGFVAEDPDYTLTGGTFTSEPYGIALNQGQVPLRESINEALAKIKKNGTYDELVEKWLPEIDGI